MSSRRFDLIYFAAFLLVVGLGYAIASREQEGTEPVTVPDFSLPSIELEAPFDPPHPFVRFDRPEPPRLLLSENMASVLVEVRDALLESSEPVEIREDARLATGPGERRRHAEQVLGAFAESGRAR